MAIAEINALLGLVVWTLVVVGAAVVPRRPMQRLVPWLAFVSLATVGVVSSISAVYPEFLETTDVRRFFAGFFRVVTIVLLTGYIWHLVRNRP